MHKKGKFSSLGEEKSCPKRTIYLSPLLLTKVQKYTLFKACRAQKRAIPFIKIQAAVIPIRQFGQEQTHKNIPVSVHSRCHFHVRDERKSKGQHPRCQPPLYTSASHEIYSLPKFPLVGR